MTTTKTPRQHRPKAKPEITFPQLCSIVTFILERIPAIDNIDLKETTKERVTAIGFRRPDSSMVYRAIDAMEHAYPNLRQEPPIEMPTARAHEERQDPTLIPRPWTKERAGPQALVQVKAMLQTVLTSATSSASSKRA